MKKTSFLICIVLAAVGFLTTLGLANPPRCAILGFKPDQYDLSTSFSDAISSNLVKTRTVEIVERAKLDLILSELKLNESGTIDQESAAKLGNVKDVNYLIYGSIISYTDMPVVVRPLIGEPTEGHQCHIEVRVRVANVSNGSILFDELVKGDSSTSGVSACLADAGFNFARAFYKLFPPVQASVVDVDNDEKIIRIDADKFVGVQVGDRFDIGDLNERTMTNGKTVTVFHKVCELQISGTEQGQIQGFVGNTEKSFFHSKPDFHRKDALLKTIEDLMKSGKTVVARPFID